MLSNSDKMAKLFFAIILFISLGLPFGGAVAQSNTDPRFSAIDTYIQSQLETYHIRGVSLAITQGDKIVHMQGFGVAAPSGTPVTPQTPMLIGSISKSFTALAIYQLVEAGKIDLNAPVEQYLPWFRVADPEASRRISIQHLLSHTSGISRSSGEKAMADEDISGTALERQVRGLSSERLNRPVGSGFEYSNSNYAVLGMVVQAVSGQPYEDTIRESIFSPLEMGHSYTSQADARLGGFQGGYRQWFGFPFPAGNLPAARGSIPAGGLISSAEDLAHYAIAQLNQGKYGQVSILSPAGVEAMHQPGATASPEGYHRKPSGSYAAGWYVMDMNAIPVIAHDGDVPDFHADVVLIPAGKWGVVLLTNTNTVLMGEGIRNIATGVTSLLAEAQPPAPETSLSTWILYISMLSALIFEVVQLIRVFLDAFRLRKPFPPTRNRGFVFRKLGLPILIGATVGLWMFVLMPLMFAVPIKVMLLNQPDITYAILIVGTLALLNGILRTGLNAVRIWKFEKPAEELMPGD